MEESAVWDRIGPQWAAYRITMRPEVREFITKTTGNILDLGCGSGRNFLKQEGLTWHGVDFSSVMIQEAKKTAEQKKMSIDLQVMDVTKLSFVDEMFDAVLCNAVLHCVKGSEHRKHVFQEMYRVLKPGGRAYVSVWSRSSKRLKHKESEGSIPWSISDETTVQRYTYIYTMKELEAEAKDAGFTIETSMESENLTLILSKVS